MRGGEGRKENVHGGEREKEKKRKKSDKVRDTWRDVSGWEKMGNLLLAIQV
jgi:hypothetical protein